VNYRHAYHAGNHGDVLKHAVLAEIVRHLLDKPAPFFVLDTHAGIGSYDLSAIEPGKTGEWEAGIGKIFGSPDPTLSPYLDLVRAFNGSGSLRHYPGSPAIVDAMKRPDDRLVLCELHPKDAAELRRWAGETSGVAVHARDGYEALKAFLPPREGRGLVIVDPPYEASDEFDRLAQSVLAGCKRWPAGRWLIWYPIKDRAPVWRFEGTLLGGGLADLISAELLIAPENGLNLAGSGVLLINPPYRIEDRLSRLLQAIQTRLAPEHGSHALRRLGNG
jgi:23S rRNA (adenine2030-N6)-methyltransferase